MHDAGGLKAHGSGLRVEGGGWFVVQRVQAVQKVQAVQAVQKVLEVQEVQEP
jgi:hypothetical protein